MKMPTERFYMHTIDGMPGYFGGTQIVFAERRDHWQDDYPLCVIRRSERQIRREQAKSRATRKAWFPSEKNPPRYDFVILSLRHGTIPWRNEDAE
jgi:hypothetical protein